MNWYMDWFEFRAHFPEQAADVLAYRRQYDDMPDPTALAFVASEDFIVAIGGALRWQHDYVGVDWKRLP